MTEDPTMKPELSTAVAKGMFKVLGDYDAECMQKDAGVKVNGYSADPGRVLALGLTNLIYDLSQEFDPVDVIRTTQEYFNSHFSR